MFELTVPTLTSADAGCVLAEWTVTEGALVGSNDTVAILETGKAAYELPAGASGRIEFLAQPGTRVLFGATIGRLVADGAVTHGPSGALAEAVAPRTPGLDGLSLSPNQEAVARTVLLSHQTIPASFLLAKAPCDRALARLRQLSAECRTLVGMPDLLVKVAATLAAEFTQLFGLPNGAPRDLDDPAIGVTIDVGKGLFIPVVRKARSKSLREIGLELNGFRRAAWDHSFRPADLMGADLSLSLSNGEGIVFAQPFVYPGQTCMLSMGGVQEEWGPQGAAARVVHVGASFDHRVVNGQYAARFLAAIRKKVEDCDVFFDP